MFTVEDLMASAIAQRPSDFEEAFNAIIAERAASAVEARKTEIAQALFNEKCSKEGGDTAPLEIPSKKMGPPPSPSAPKNFEGGSKKKKREEEED
jgi:hypothetical protein